MLYDVDHYCPFFSWPLYCLFFFELWLLITPLVSWNFSYKYTKSWTYLNGSQLYQIFLIKTIPPTFSQFSGKMVFLSFVISYFHSTHVHTHMHTHTHNMQFNAFQDSTWIQNIFQLCWSFFWGRNFNSILNSMNFPSVSTIFFIRS